MTYSISTTDYAGTGITRTFTDWEAVMLQARVWARRYPFDSIDATNDDLLDCDTDGLTWDEKSELWDAVSDARETREVTL